jgi:hypothetical protein
MVEEFLPPRDLIIFHDAWKNPDSGRAGGLPVAKGFYQTQLKRKVLEDCGRKFPREALRRLDYNLGMKLDPRCTSEIKCYPN